LSDFSEGCHLFTIFHVLRLSLSYIY
jgi:hypothetical protein